MEKKQYSSYDKVKIARDKDRAGIIDYIDSIFDGFIELHGDRLYKDDPSVVGGIAWLRDIPVTVIGHRKGKNTQEQIKYNFGMASPEGYRKARRLMEEAEKFHRPIITFIDTPGAYPGLEAEANGQSNAIAENLAYMSRLRVPSIAIITGEGSSGGALAIGVADRVWMLENAVYSILSPEGFASILWKDSKLASKASDLMRLTAQDLKEDGLIDEIIPEDERTFRIIKQKLTKALSDLLILSENELQDLRYEKYRKIDQKKGRME